MNQLGLQVGVLCCAGRDAVGEALYYLELLLKGVHHAESCVWFAMPAVQRCFDNACLDAVGYYSAAEELGHYMPIRGPA